MPVPGFGKMPTSQPLAGYLGSRGAFTRAPHHLEQEATEKTERPFLCCLCDLLFKTPRFDPRSSELVLPPSFTRPKRSGAPMHYRSVRAKPELASVRSTATDGCRQPPRISLSPRAAVSCQLPVASKKNGPRPETAGAISAPCLPFSPSSFPSFSFPILLRDCGFLFLLGRRSFSTG